MVSRRTALAAALSTVVVGAGCGTPGSEPASGGPGGGGGFAIDGAVLFDGERAVGPGTVVVEGAHITAAGPGVPVPAGVDVVDGRGKTVLPGLVDCHVHAFGLSADAPRFGVTTELDMFAFLDPLGPYREQRGSTAPTENSDVWTAGTLATAPGGHGTQFGPIPTLAPDAGAAEADRFVADRLAEGSDYIKVVMEDWSLYGMSPGPTLTPEQVGFLITAAHEHGAMCVVHVTTQDDAVLAFEAGADGLAHVPGDPISERVIDAALRARGFVTATLSVFASMSCAGVSEGLETDPLLSPLLTTEQRDALRRPATSCYPGILPAAKENVRALHEAGVTVLAGTDVGNAGVARGVSLLGELELLTDAGLSPVDALHAATGAPAARFPLGARGRLAPDQRADLVLVNGDATQDITAMRDIDRVWRNGRPVDRRP